MRVLVLGYGSAGRRHAANLLELGHEVVVYDPAIFPDYTWGRAQASPVDAWVIASPLTAHFEAVSAAVAREMPFYVEKPIGGVDQYDAWAGLCREALPVHQVGYQLRWHREAVALKAGVGKPTGGRFICESAMRQWPGRSYGHPLLEMSHEIDLALWCGAPSLVTSVDRLGESYQIRLGDHWSVWLDGAPADDSYWRRWECFGTLASGSCAFTSADELGHWMYHEALASFLDHVRTGTPTDCTLHDGLRVLDVCRQVLTWPVPAVAPC